MKDERPEKRRFGRFRYTNREYFWLGLLLCLVALAVALLLYHNSEQIVEDEVVNLNQTVLTQLSSGTAEVVEEARILCSNLVNDTTVIRSAEKEAFTEADTAALQRYLNNWITDYTWVLKNGQLMEACVFGYNGIGYTSGNMRLSLGEIQANPALSDVFLPSTSESSLAACTYPEEPGIYRYGFFAAQEIRDHLDGSPCGVVVVRVSEGALYGAYAGNGQGHRETRILDAEGRILSSADKREIGTLDVRIGNEFPDGEKGYAIRNLDGERYLLFCNRITGTQWYLTRIVSYATVMEPLRGTRLFAIAITAAAVILMCILVNASRNRMRRPIATLLDEMQKVSEGDLSVRAEVRNQDEFGEMSYAFNHMVEQIEALLRQTAEGEKQKRLADLDFLRAQINPHFIYNTLSTIRFCVEMNQSDKAQEMLILFSKILRRSLSRTEEFVPVRDELETTRAYVELQKLRYTDQILFTVEIDPAVLAQTVPTFLLQPIVENAIFYNMGSRGSVHVTLRGRICADAVELSVSDDGAGMTDAQMAAVMDQEDRSNHVGILNVHDRIRLNYGADYGLRLTHGADGGLTVTLRLPYDAAAKGELPT